MFASSNRPTAGQRIARALMASVFIVMGGWRLLAAAQGATIPNGTLIFSGIEAALGLLILFGWKLRITALLAALLMAVDAVLSHPFWSLAEPERGAQLLHFMKNVNIVGGFLLLALVSSARPRR